MEHNIYDLQSYDPKSYPYGKVGRTYIRMRRACILFCILLVLVTAAYVIFSDFYWQALILLIIFGIWDFCLEILLLYRVTARLTGKKDAQAAHDYNYYLFVHDKSKRKGNYLLALAHNQLKLDRPAAASAALQMFEIEKANLQQRWQFYLLRAAAAKQEEQTEALEKNIEYCNLTGTGGTLVSEQMTTEELLQIYRENTDIKKAVSVFRKIFFVLTYAMLACFYICQEQCLPSGVFYRQWFSYAGYTLIWLAGTGITGWMMIAGCKRVWKNLQAGWYRLYMMLGCLVIGALILGAAFLSYITKIASVEEEIDNRDGTVTVVQYGGEKDLYKKEGWFLRRYIGEAEPEISEAEEEIEPETNSGNPSQDFERLAEIYDEVYLATGNELEYELQYSAKGVLYLCTEAQQTEEGTVRWRVVYDRESENGACSEFVYYKDVYPEGERAITDTQIINFYAYVHESGEVITANKTNWGGGGDQEYRDATGE